MHACYHLDYNHKYVWFYLPANMAQSKAHWLQRKLSNDELVENCYLSWEFLNPHDGALCDRLSDCKREKIDKNNLGPDLPNPALPHDADHFFSVDLIMKDIVKRSSMHFSENPMSKVILYSTNDKRLYWRRIDFRGRLANTISPFPSSFTLSTADSFIMDASMFSFTGSLFVLLISSKPSSSEPMLLALFSCSNLRFCCFERDADDVEAGTDGETTLTGLPATKGERGDTGVLMPAAPVVCLLLALWEGILHTSGVLRCSLVIGWEKSSDPSIPLSNLVPETVAGLCQSVVFPGP